MNKLPVAVISDHSPQRALFVSPDMKLETVLERLLDESTHKSIFLIDEKGVLAGIMNLKELLIWGWLHLGLISVPFPLLSERKLRRLGRSQLAADLSIPDSQEMTISLQTTIEQAMNTLLLSNLNVVAVVNENGRVVNDLHVDDLLANTMKEAKGRINA